MNPETIDVSLYTESDELVITLKLIKMNPMANTIQYKNKLFIKETDIKYIETSNVRMHMEKHHDKLIKNYIPRLRYERVQKSNPNMQAMIMALKKVHDAEGISEETGLDVNEVIKGCQYLTSLGILKEGIDYNTWELII